MGAPGLPSCRQLFFCSVAVISGLQYHSKSNGARVTTADGILLPSAFTFFTRQREFFRLISPAHNLTMGTARVQISGCQERRSILCVLAQRGWHYRPSIIGHPTISQPSSHRHSPTFSPEGITSFFSCILTRRMSRLSSLLQCLVAPRSIPRRQRLRRLFGSHLKKSARRWSQRTLTPTNCCLSPRTYKMDVRYRAAQPL